MNLCRDKHEEICYDDHRCPMCVLLDKIRVLEDNIDSLQIELGEKE